MRDKKYILYLVFIFVSCNSVNDNKIQNLDSNAISRDIPLDKRGKPKSIYNKKNEIESKVGLKTMETGFDTMQIRIWYGVALSDSLQLLVLEDDKVKWTGRFYQIKYQYSNSRDSIVSCSKSIHLITPKSGWTYAKQKLLSLGILTLPDSGEIPDYSICNDGSGVTIEVATKNKYRIYNYPCINAQKGIWQADSISKIIQVLEEEFEFKRLAI